MTAAVLRRDPGNAVTAIADLARSLNLTVLVAIEAIGLCSMLVIFAAAPARWPFVLPALSIASFGVWGVCDRRIALLTSHKYKSQRRFLRFISRAVAAVGVLAALLGVYLFIGWMMGVYIS